MHGICACTSTAVKSDVAHDDRVAATRIWHAGGDKQLKIGRDISVACEIWRECSFLIGRIRAVFDFSLLYTQVQQREMFCRYMHFVGKVYGVKQGDGRVCVVFA